MKLGFSAWAMAHLPVDQQVQIVRDAGYAGIELVSDPGLGLDARTIAAGERRRLRRLLDEAGLALPSIAAHANVLEGTDARREAARAGALAAIDLAVDLAGAEGPPCVVTMAYGRAEHYERDRELIAERYGQLAEHAGARGVVIALEPHVRQALDRPERVRWLLERIDSPHYRLNLDNSHFEVMGYGIDTYVTPLTPYAVHTHLKDQRGLAPAYEFLVPGEGDFDYPAYLAAMEAAGYTGFITVEISKQVHKRPGYDPAAVAAQSFETLTGAAARAGVGLETGRQGSRIA